MNTNTNDALAIAAALLLLFGTMLDAWTLMFLAGVAALALLVYRLAPRAR